MSKTMSVRLSDEQLSDIEQIKRRYHQPSVSSALQLLLREKLRETRHPHIVFRDTGVGRQAFLEGTRLKVWIIMMVARDYENDSVRTAQHLCIPESMVEAAFAYAREFADEIDAELAFNDAMDFEALKRILPNLELIEVPADYDLDSPVS